MALGQKIRGYIREAGMKQIDVCKALNLSPSRLSNYLSGSREPDFETLGMICDLLGIKVDDLRKDKPETDHIGEAITALTESEELPVMVIRGNDGKIHRVETTKSATLGLLANMRGIAQTKTA